MTTELKDSENTRILLYMDILGSRKIIDEESDKSAMIKELIDVFSKNNKEYCEENIPVSPRKCYLIKSSLLPSNNNHDKFSIPDWTGSYIRFENQLFYILKSASQCEEITGDLEVLARFDNELKTNEIELDQPKLLSDTELNTIKGIANHTHSVGLTKFSRVNPTISSYSDHISISVPFDSDKLNMISNIGNLISHASWLHHLALNNGFLMRGAITMGSLIHKGNVIVGIALNKAVTLEETVAIYPRVVIEKSVIKLITQYQAPSLFLDIDQDGLYFINYLKDARYINKKFQQYISSLLCENLQTFDTDNLMGVYSKWHWLESKLRNVYAYIQALPEMSA
jgi:hypothetical protein